jgi:hypothetical protein
VNGPLLYLSRVRIVQLQDVLEDHHCLGSDDESERFAQGVHRGRRELLPGGLKRSLNQGCAAVLSPRNILVVLSSDAALQGLHQHHSERCLIGEDHVVKRSIDALHAGNGIMRRVAAEQIVRFRDTDIERSFDEKRFNT